MFELDDQFLKDLGLEQMPDEQKQAFLAHIYNELELRVGVRLSEGLSDEQLEEFEAFVDRNSEKVQSWVMANSSNYQNDPLYQQLKANAPQDSEDTSVLAEYASLKWLHMNRPNYRDVVSNVLDELKQEIMTNRDQILGGADQLTA